MQRAPRGSAGGTLASVDGQEAGRGTVAIARPTARGPSLTQARGRHQHRRLPRTGDGRRRPDQEPSESGSETLRKVNVILSSGCLG